MYFNQRKMQKYTVLQENKTPDKKITYDKLKILCTSKRQTLFFYCYSSCKNETKTFSELNYYIGNK